MVAFFLTLNFMKIRDFTLGIAFALIWSSAFTSARISMFDAPPFLLLSLRFLISGIIAIGLAHIIGQSIQFSRSEWYAILVFGVFQNTIYLGLNFVAMQWIDASLAATIASILPLIITIFLWLFFKEKLSTVGLLGLVIGLTGLILIIKASVPDKLNAIGIVLCFLGVISLSIATIIVRNSSGKNMLMLIGLQMLVGSITLFPLSISFETWEINWTKRLIVSFIYTIIFPGLIATLIWFKLLHFIGPIKAASFHFLNPFFGVLIAHVILSEQLESQQLVGVLLVTVAILSIQLSKMTKNSI